jgi:phosphoglycerate dehydrogenase-like enzyme
MTQVLFIFPPEDELKAYFESKLKDIPDIELIVPKDRELDTLLPYAPTSDIMIGWRPEQKLLDAAGKLGLFIAPGAGVQHLIEPFKKFEKPRQVILTNSHGNAYFTAQHGVAMLFALMNRIVVHHNWMAQGKWRTGDDEAKSIPLRDKTVGFLGYGNIGSHIHRFLSGFDLNFSALRMNWKKLKADSPTSLERYDISELDDFLKYCDILFVTLPHTKITEGLIKMSQLEFLGEKGLIVSLGRGKTIDEDAFYNALKNRIIAGAAIDVWYDYQPQRDEHDRLYPYHFPFHELDNIVLSPHRAASPFDDLRRWDDVIENIRRFAKGQSDFLNVIDLDAGY